MLLVYPPYHILTRRPRVGRPAHCPCPPSSAPPPTAGSRRDPTATEQVPGLDLASGEKQTRRTLILGLLTVKRTKQVFPLRWKEEEKTFLRCLTQLYRDKDKQRIQRKSTWNWTTAQHSQLVLLVRQQPSATGWCRRAPAPTPVEDWLRWRYCFFLRGGFNLS